MTIKRNLSAKVQGQRMVLDSPIYFYQGDRDICLVITITGNKYIYDKDTKLSFVIVKPNGEVVENAMSALINGKYNVLLTRELFDGVDEVGQFLCQLRQHNGSAIVSLPPFAIHVLKGYSISLDDATDGLLTEQEFMLLTENNKSLSVGGLIKISDLPTTTKVEGYTPVTQGDTTYKLDMTNVASKTYVATEIAKVGEEIDLSSYATKDDLANGLTTKANKEHTHTISDVNGLQAELDGYATETYVQAKIAEASLAGGEVDLSAYATKDEVNSSLATKSDVGHTHEQYLTKHQDISMKADKTELHSHTNKTVLDGITSTKVTEWNNKSNFDGNYNSLTNKPNIPTVDVNKNYVDTQLATKANKSEIPSLDGYATETYVQAKIAEASLGGDGEVDLSEYATKDDLNTKADKTAIPTKVSQLTNDKGYLTSHQDITGKADKTYVNAELAKKANASHAHSYNDLTDKPTIPSTTNLATKKELTDGLATKANKSEIPSLEGYATETFVTNKIAEASLSGGEVDLSGLATKEELATKADKTAIPTKTSQLTNDSGFLTEHQDLSDYALKTELPTVPTKVSQLANDSGFITTIPTEYVTETELNDKGYLTEHQDISGKANISDLSSVATSGNYNDLINKPTIPNEYVLPIASTTTLGGIKVGSGLSIDTNGVLSATGTGGTVGNGIIFNDSYVADCNTWLTNGYVKTNTSTSNLPALCTGADRYGVLFFIAENTTYGTGTQMYFPIDGTYKGRVFTRSLVAMTERQAGEWVLLAIQSDIPSIDGLATETYVNNKMTPSLVEKTVANRTLTLTVDKYQHAVLSNGDSVVLPSVSSFTEIHLFFKASSDLTLTFPSVRWQSIPSITSGHTYEIIFTYVVNEWLAGIICYE